MVKTHATNARGMSSIPDWELRTHMLYDWAKKKNNKKRIPSLGPNPRDSASVAWSWSWESVFPRGPQVSQMTLMLSWPRTGPASGPTASR